MKKTMKKNIFGFALSAILFALCVSAEAQRAKKAPRIGVLDAGSPHVSVLLGPLREGLRELGYMEGKNVVIEYRSADGKLDRLPDLAADLVRSKVEVIVPQSPPAVRAAHKATKSIPVVMAGGGDPVEQGFVQSLARPGGNLTGLSSMTVELAGKRLEVFKDALPRLSRLAVLGSSVASPVIARQLKEIELVAPTLGIRIRFVEAPRPDDLDNAFSAIAKDQPHGLFIMRSPFLGTHLKRVTDFTERARLPTMYDDRGYVERGGLMSYGTSVADLSRRAATYVDKILKGAKPADLPVEQPMKFELVINLKTAKQIRLTIPPNVLARADKVIR
ncbi:MAG: ABC transporter substrate-binding protein [Candidatus Binatia bacterium]